MLWIIFLVAYTSQLHLTSWPVSRHSPDNGVHPSLTSLYTLCVLCSSISRSSLLQQALGHLSTQRLGSPSARPQPAPLPTPGYWSLPYKHNLPTCPHLHSQHSSTHFPPLRISAPPDGGAKIGFCGSLSHKAFILLYMVLFRKKYL